MRALFPIMFPEVSHDVTMPVQKSRRSCNPTRPAALSRCRVFDPLYSARLGQSIRSRKQSKSNELTG